MFTFLKMQDALAASETSNSAAAFCMIESCTIMEAVRVGIEVDLTSFVDYVV